MASIKLDTKLVSQADRLDIVVHVARAVLEGHTTYQSITREISRARGITYDERQGRYYRKAAENLGLIENEPHKNESRLTKVGVALVSSQGQEYTALISEALLGVPLFQRLIPFLEGHQVAGCSRQQLECFLREVTVDTTDSMIGRRASTVVAWLKHADLIASENKKYFLKTADLPLTIVTYESVEEPLLPTLYKLREYEEVAARVKRAATTINFAISGTERERASDSHRRLTNLLAARVRAAGGIPRSNKLVDLAASIQTQDFLFEVKSTTEANARDQARAGISQLYEYRYLQNAPLAKLVLLLENRFPRDLSWMVDYLVSDRQVLIVWDGDGDKLYCPKELEPEIGFLL